MQQPVDDADDMLVVGRELAAAPELHELLEVRDLAVCALVLLRRALDRLREVEELDDIADDAPDIPM